jgi:hypothetical protein
VDPRKIIPIFAILLIIPFAYQQSFAQYSAGGVDLDGDWYVGESLEVGDYFKYKMCHTDYKDCTDFVMSMWVSDKRMFDTEEKYIIQVMVQDGKKIIKGEMHVGDIAPEPTGGSDNISPYRGAYKSSIAWLSAYATKEIVNTAGDVLTGKGPKDFSAASWGKIANIGGEQILPTAIETVTTQADTFETVLIQWKTGGVKSQVWIVDEFPFPVKAKTHVHVSSGVPPVEYEFELLDYDYYVTSDPFAQIVSTESQQVTLGCPTDYDKVSVHETTNSYSVIIDLKYGPPNPLPGCDMELFINFMRTYNPTEFVNEIHYDIWVVNDNGEIIRSVADDEGRQKLFTTSGQVYRTIVTEEEPGIAKFAIMVYGFGPEMIAPSGEDTGYITFDVNIAGEKPKQIQTFGSDNINIPDWVKNNAGWWADDQIDDAAFVTSLQWLINNDIMEIPDTVQGSSTGTSTIPNWVKNNAEWWADGQIDDKSFVTGIQWLISNGVLKIS